MYVCKHRLNKIICPLVSVLIQVLFREKKDKILLSRKWGIADRPFILHS